MGQLNLYSRQTNPHPHVEVIQRAGAHFDQNFVCFDFRIGDFSELQNLRPAVLFENDGFHSCSGRFCGPLCGIEIILIILIYELKVLRSCESIQSILA